jgi:outer membrane murein-binding lipoprotein Lpp
MTELKHDQLLMLIMDMSDEDRAVLRQHLVPRPAGEVGGLVEWLKGASEFMRRTGNGDYQERIDQAAAHLTALSAEVERLNLNNATLRNQRDAAQLRALGAKP